MNLFEPDEASVFAARQIRTTQRPIEPDQATWRTLPFSFLILTAFWRQEFEQPTRGQISRGKVCSMSDASLTRIHVDRGIAFVRWSKAFKSSGAAHPEIPTFA